MPPTDPHDMSTPAARNGPSAEQEQLLRRAASFAKNARREEATRMIASSAVDFHTDHLLVEALCDLLGQLEVEQWRPVLDRVIDDRYDPDQLRAAQQRLLDRTADDADAHGRTERSVRAAIALESHLLRRGQSDGAASSDLAPRSPEWFSTMLLSLVDEDPQHIGLVAASRRALVASGHERHAIELGGALLPRILERYEDVGLDDDLAHAHLRALVSEQLRDDDLPPSDLVGYLRVLTRSGHEDDAIAIAIAAGRQGYRLSDALIELARTIHPTQLVDVRAVVDAQGAMGSKIERRLAIADALRRDDVDTAIDLEHQAVIDDISDGTTLAELAAGDPSSAAAPFIEHLIQSGRASQAMLAHHGDLLLRRQHGGPAARMFGELVRYGYSSGRELAQMLAGTHRQEALDEGHQLREEGYEVHRDLQAAMATPTSSWLSRRLGQGGTSASTGHPGRAVRRRAVGALPPTPATDEATVPPWTPMPSATVRDFLWLLADYVDATDRADDVRTLASFLPEVEGQSAGATLRALASTVTAAANASEGWVERFRKELPYGPLMAQVAREPGLRARVEGFFNQQTGANAAMVRRIADHPVMSELFEQPPRPAPSDHPPPTSVRRATQRGRHLHL